MRFALGGLIRFLIGVPLISTAMPSFAEWNLDTVRSVSGSCVIRESQIDETKLTLRFSDFALNVPGSNSLPTSAVSQCSISVLFRLPANHRFKTLTHRIFARGRKDYLSELSLKSSVKLADRLHRQLGRLAFGTSYSGRLLLYRSFDLGAWRGCQPDDQDFEVSADWLLELKVEANAQQAFLDVSGEQEWIDLWLDVEQCEAKSVTLDGID